MSKRQPPPPPFGAVPNHPDRAYDWYGWGVLPSTPTAIHFLSARRREFGADVLQRDSIRGDLRESFTKESRFDTASILAIERRKADLELLPKFLAIDCKPTHIFSFWYEFLRDDSKKPQILFHGAVNLDLKGLSKKALAQSVCEDLRRIAWEERAIVGSSGTTIAPPVLMQKSLFTGIFWLTAIYQLYRSRAIPQR